MQARCTRTRRAIPEAWSTLFTCVHSSVTGTHVQPCRMSAGSSTSNYCQDYPSITGRAGEGLLNSNEADLRPVMAANVCWNLSVRQAQGVQAQGCWTAMRRSGGPWRPPTRR